MVRDKLKNLDYFHNFINYESNRIIKFTTLINKVVSEKGDNDAGVKKTRHSIFNFSIHCFLAQYSMGENISVLEAQFVEVIDFKNNATDSPNEKVDFILDTYIDLLWLFSISIMLEVEDDHFNKLISVYEKHSEKDLLIDTLIAYRNKDYMVSQKLLYPEEFKPLMEILNFNKQEAEEKIEHFLKKEWYKRMKDTSWQDNHKSKHDTYFGYWSFESGAIVKIMGLDDSSFKDNQYYPYDMVHYKG